MKYFLLIVIFLLVSCQSTPSHESEYKFVDLFNGKDLSGWVDVNTSPTTWKAVDGELHCTGLPIGVMRSEKKYENFIMEIEWRHMNKKGNSGVFIWSEANIRDNRLPDGLEVQMLELDWVNRPSGKKAHDGYTSGELFGVGGVKIEPENRRGSRSQARERRCNGVGEWNKYVIVAVDGVVKLSINGKFVNSVSHVSQRKGYLCLEAEGSEIHFRNISIMELPSSSKNKPLPSE
ncbi:MAG: DUF1080 domain-containing protein [Lentisphaeraceae bacterium]|nr:DUF1080 domain-containing protein [Lentisphaeraceae bacterium]